MKAVILAGGLGTRISEETHLRPKPMIEIGAKPMLWHIMKIYAAHNITDFIVCCGYKGYLIKEYFANYYLHASDITFNLARNEMEIHSHNSERWKVTLVDTGEHAMTGGRLKKVQPFLSSAEAFCLTYGDGLSDINITELIRFHKKHGKLATVTAVQPPGRYGALNLNGSNVGGFSEKPKGEGGWVNGGFFVLSPKCIDYIETESTIWEDGPLKTLSKNGDLMAYKHYGFWQSMDTLRDKNLLERLWSTDKAPWLNSVDTI